MEKTNTPFSILKIIIALTLGYGCAIAWVVYADIVYNNNVPLDAIQFHGLYPISLGLSAILTTLLFDKNLRSIGFTKFNLKYLGAAVAIAGSVLIIPFLVNLIIQVTQINPEPVFDTGLIAIGIPVLIILAIGEEVMWRGLLYSELSKKYNFVTTSFITGILWTIWHYPVIIHTKFIYADRPLWFALTVFTTLVISASFVYNYIRKISGSLWPCIFLHALTNYFAFVLIEPLEKGRSETSIYFMNDIGVFYMLIFVAGAFWVIKKGGSAPVSI